MSMINQELHRLVVTAIIVKNSKYLIVQRSHEKKAWPGVWTVPGGGLETDDYVKTPKTNIDCWYLAVENALCREIKEEVNLTIKKPNYLLDLAFIRLDGIPVITFSFYAKWQSGQVKLQDKENIDWQWVSYKQAKKYSLVPGLLGEIEMIDKICKGVDPVKVKYRP